MCYSVKYLKDKLHKYAKHHDLDDSVIPQLFDQHYVSGFAHPELPIITDIEPNAIQAFNWGLIPFWVKDALTATKLSNQTLNARSETMFEKPSFRNSSMSRRCLILVDGFYEYYHINGKKIPYYIFLKDQETMLMAGLWEKWELKKENISRYTVSIVTTHANDLMAKIHNNPATLKRTGPRMPLIIPEELKKEWLLHNEDPQYEKQRINDLLLPYPSDLMGHYSVAHSLGNNGVGNSDKAWKRMDYNIESLP
jgi:putative SOS response-associated peptidase YedK